MTSKTNQQVDEFNDILDPINDIASEIVEERLAQIDKWGHQDRDYVFTEPYRTQFHSLADRWKQINDAREAEGIVTWDSVLLEEVYEALCETDPDKQVAELIQVAAVAAAIVENIRVRVAEEKASQPIPSDPEGL